MLNKLKKNNQGFTIIEVMIVLAIAGLIMLIVFLAVPALQRNSRNTQRKSDIGRIASAATTVVSNNNGNISSVTTANMRAEVGSLGYYDASANLSAVAPLTSGGARSNSTTVDSVLVVPNGACNGNNATYANRQIAVLYSIEAGNGNPTHVCTDQ